MFTLYLSSRQLILAVIFLPFYLFSIQVSAATCIPSSSAAIGSQAMALTVCESNNRVTHLSGYTATFPANGKLSVQIPFQIRSCGDQTCNRATRFNLLSKGVTLQNDQTNPTSTIPLTVSIKQQHTSATVTFPEEGTCTDGVSQCPFQGAGLQEGLYPDNCDNCVNFELTFNADLNALMNNGTLNQAGTHRGTLTFRIDQAYSSSNPDKPDDANHERDVDIDISINVPALIQISGLRDMTLDSTTRSGSQLFCVYASGTGRFDLDAESKTALEFSDEKFRLKNGSDYLIYTMTINDGTRSKTYSNNSQAIGWPLTPSSEYLCSDHQAENMTLTIDVETGASAGVYNDTMRLIVTPK